MATTHRPASFDAEDGAEPASAVLPASTALTLADRGRRHRPHAHGQRARARRGVAVAAAAVGLVVATAVTVSGALYNVVLRAPERGAATWRSTSIGSPRHSRCTSCRRPRAARQPPNRPASAAANLAPFRGSPRSRRPPGRSTCRPHASRACSMHAYARARRPVQTSSGRSDSRFPPSSCDPTVPRGARFRRRRTSTGSPWTARQRLD
ncbi:MAG: hypothetical protein JWO86_4883 [Myxococcaceae bacterium]|nr:hypothetical protein [Myxococcaceae bacterium]